MARRFITLTAAAALLVCSALPSFLTIMGADIAAAVEARTAVGAVGPVVAPMSLAAPGTGVVATGTVEAGIMLVLAAWRWR